MSRRISDSLVSEVAAEPSMLRQDLQGEDISALTAVFVVGRLIRPESFTSQMRNENFEGYWRQRVGMATTQDFTKIPEKGVEAHVMHLLAVVDAVQNDPQYEGVWEEIQGHAIFRLANEMGAGIDLPESEADADPEFGADDFDTSSEVGGGSRRARAESRDGIPPIDLTRNYN